MSGNVIVEVVVDEDGRVACTRVVKGLPFGLSAAATEALGAWSFEPLEIGGEAVRYTALVQVEFRINRPKAGRSKLWER